MYEKNYIIANVKDKITIRGKGKFIVDEFVGTNKKGEEIYLIKKYY